MSSQQRLLLMIVVLGAAGVGLWFLGSKEGVSGAGELQAAGARPETGHERRVENLEPSADDASGRSLAIDVWPNADLRDYRLRTTVRESDGSPVEAEQVTWRMRCADVAGGSRPSLNLVPSAGEVAFRARVGARVLVLEARVGERLVHLPESILVLGEEEEIDLIGELPGSGLVRVLDASTGGELSTVQVIPWTCSPAETELPSLHALRGGCSSTSASPLSLPRNWRETPCWIGAPGYAWRRIRFGASSGQPVYTLQAGGGLRVDARVPSSVSSDFLLQIDQRVPGTTRVERLAEEPLGTGEPLEIHGLPTGELTLRLLEHSSSSRDHVIAEQTASIQAGAVAEVAFDIEELWRGEEYGTIHLTLSLEDPLDVKALEVRADCIEGSQKNSEVRPVIPNKQGLESVVTWVARGRSVGRHSLTVLPSGESIEVLVERGRTTRSALSVPALPKLRLHVVDAASNDPVAVDRILWRPGPTEPVAEWRLVDRGETRGSIEFALSLGSIEIGVQADGYVSARESFEVTTGWNEQLVELRPLDSREVLLLLKSGGSDLPVPEETWSTLRAVKSSGEEGLIGLRMQSDRDPQALGPTESSAILVVDGPGTYQVSLATIPGYRLPPSQVVVVGNELVTVEFDLVLEPTVGK